MDSLTGKLGMGIGDYGVGDSSSKEDGGIKMVDRVVKSFRVAKLFRENTDRINHMDFSANGDLLISSADDDQIVIYDCEKGLAKRTLNSKKYGVDLIHFTHAKNTAIHSSTKIDDTIRYLSLHDNKYLRYFPGHTKKVTTLCMSPTDDTFLSGSLDKQLRLWDLRSPNCQGLMHLMGKPVAGFDPEGLIFAAGVSSEVVKLYDLRSFDKGPFATFKFSYEKDNEWTSLKFSPDGKTMMICSNGSVIRIIDAFHGTPLQTFVRQTPAQFDRALMPPPYHPTPRQSPILIPASRGPPPLRPLSPKPSGNQYHNFKPGVPMLNSPSTPKPYWSPSGTGRSYDRSSSPKSMDTYGSPHMSNATGLPHLTPVHDLAKGRGGHLSPTTYLGASRGHANNKNQHLEASYSPDSQYVFCGSSDGIIHVWSVENGYKVSSLNADHPGPVECVKFNPKFMMMATACTNMAFWLPTVDE